MKYYIHGTVWNSSTKIGRNLAPAILNWQFIRHRFWILSNFEHSWNNKFTKISNRWKPNLKIKHSYKSRKILNLGKLGLTTKISPISTGLPTLTNTSTIMSTLHKPSKTQKISYTYSRTTFVSLKPSICKRYMRKNWYTCIKNLRKL